MRCIFFWLMAELRKFLEKGVTPAICGTTYTPVGQTQTYVDTQFGGTGGWKTPPVQTGENAITGGLVASPGVRRSFRRKESQGQGNTDFPLIYYMQAFFELSTNS